MLIDSNIIIYAADANSDNSEITTHNVKDFVWISGVTVIDPLND